MWGNFEGLRPRLDNEAQKPHHQNEAPHSLDKAYFVFLINILRHAEIQLNLDKCTTHIAREGKPLFDLFFTLEDL